MLCKNDPKVVYCRGLCKACYNKLWRSEIQTEESKARQKSKLPDCVVCGKKVSKRYTHCIKCRSSKKPKLDWRRNLPTCIDCGKRVSTYSTKRCRKCWDKHPEHKKQLSLAHLGKPSHRKFQDRTKLKRSLNSKIRQSSAYKDWHLSVKKRDGWKCMVADNFCNGRVESHHIYVWKDYPDKRYDIENGITLCRKHHQDVRSRETENIGRFVMILVQKYEYSNI